MLFIEAATLSAEFGRITNVRFECGDLANSQLATADKKYQAVIVNPPRRGLDNDVITFLKGSKPKLVLYSSCNPTTLFRDIETLSSAYQLTSLKPYVMFPLSRHIEVLAVLEKK